MSLTQELFEFAGQVGADSIGVVSAQAYEAIVPNLQKPSLTAKGSKSLVCFVKRMLTGSFATRDIPVQSVNSHLCMDQIDRISMEIAEWLENRGFWGIPVPPEAADMSLQRSPAGTLDFKWVAEESGVGTVGLELNLLTPDYGPRVYIGVVMTDAPLQSTPKLEKSVPRNELRPMRGDLSHSSYPSSSPTGCAHYGISRSGQARLREWCRADWHQAVSPEPPKAHL